MPALQYFSRNLVAAMDATDTTVRELAGVLDTSPSYVQRVRSGHVDPSLGQAERFAKALGMDLVDMLVPPREFTPPIVDRAG